MAPVVTSTSDQPIDVIGPDHLDVIARLGEVMLLARSFTVGSYSQRARRQAWVAWVVLGGFMGALCVGLASGGHPRAPTPTHAHPRPPTTCRPDGSTRSKRTGHGRHQVNICGQRCASALTVDSPVCQRTHQCPRDYFVWVSVDDFGWVRFC